MDHSWQFMQYAKIQFRVSAVRINYLKTVRNVTFAISFRRLISWLFLPSKPDNCIQSLIPFVDRKQIDSFCVGFTAVSWPPFDRPIYSDAVQSSHFPSPLCPVYYIDSRIACIPAEEQSEHISESSPVLRILDVAAKSSTRRPLTFDSWPQTPPTRLPDKDITYCHVLECTVKPCIDLLYLRCVYCWKAYGLQQQEMDLPAL